MGNLSKAQFIFSKNLAKLILYIYELGYTCSIGEVWRTQEQAEIYAKEGKGIKDSLHLYKLAADINLFRFGEYLTNYESYKKFGEYWESLNVKNRWGGNFVNRDASHFEMYAKNKI